MKEELKYSLQTIFMQIGQYDRYAIFDFKFGSEAFNKYGSTVYGYIIYTPSQRAALKAQTNSGEIPYEDGLIILDGALQDPETNKLLKSDGFYVHDIRSLSTMDLGPIANQYDNTQTKDIPNTITLDFSPSLLDGERMQYMNFNNRIKEGIPLIAGEKRQYYALMLLLDRQRITEGDKQQYLIDPDTGYFFDDVVLTLFKTYASVDEKGSTSRKLVNRALGNRRRERTKFICRHLGIAEKHIDKLKVYNEPAWRELMKLIYGFESEVLTLWGWRHQIYWDFERFIHIYLRHYKDFLINGSSKGQGTGFQYTLKDIRRIINIVLEQNHQAIEERLDQGKGFHIQNDKGHYYNGNYYSLRINPDGKLMQFHPQDNF
ncbi:hypothetical protein [Pedobacter duraquae]|uniref:Uncharacterized protein n=1 Tax=Pedobacter duraquae TaxID=425511 RepID=A0A4R6IP02_9SPHI|nr:hypothetical protein [Pedobacter duraquae]TDO23726.1 hypothetical protein CLV32_0010 [Pedobacter duraquae]